MPESIRSFLAFDIESSTVLNRFATTQNSLVQTGADLKLVASQNTHITVRFLGNIKPTIVEKIFEEMQKIQFAKFNVQIKGLGAFPDLHYPRVV